MEELVQSNVEQIRELKCQIFDIIREEEPLVINRERLTTMANAQINEINNEINKFENLKSSLTQELLKLEAISRETETLKKAMIV